ncbi:metallophosphoesterase [Clostridium aceticum]|uniref:Metallophosphoesterase n=1 Tax=Clostridium aceticum TaxID=84022 RepID=A0A0D8I7Q8_9CLOT|nr:metallophosphoesterase [Clostridium aceticum]AKL97263.1 metallophosphoesterase [Clostridium aceticum]KJF26288.1 hypothetical protein TZ02_14030 [Clostridium aceticum]
MEVSLQQKVLIIGDIHGCYDEMIELIDKSQIDLSRDWVISVGDIVDRGMKTPEVFSFFQNTPHALMILGNHEAKHLFQHHKKKVDLTDPSVAIQKRMIEPNQYSVMLDYLRSQPLYQSVEYPNKKYLILHAGITEDIDLQDMPLYLPEDYVKDEKIKTIIGRGSRRRKGFDEKSTPWYDEISSAYTIVFGHQITQEVIRGENKNVYGIDTGCCRGGKLTGLLLPEEKNFQVEAKKNYYDEIEKNYLDSYYLEVFDLLSEKQKETLLQQDNIEKTKKKIQQEMKE